jgi:hypothetical protein
MVSSVFGRVNGPLWNVAVRFCAGLVLASPLHSNDALSERHIQVPIDVGEVIVANAFLPAGVPSVDTATLLRPSLSL